MKIGTQTDVLQRIFGAHETLNIIKKAGFETVDYSLFSEYQLDMSYQGLKTYYSQIAKHAEQLELPIVQTHAPFYGWRTQFERYDEIVEIQKRAIAATAYLGAKYVIIHPLRTNERIYEEDVENTKRINVDYYSKLVPVLKEYDIYLAVENMFANDPETKQICPTGCTTAEEMCDYIDSMGDRFVACLDVGHVNLIHQAGYEHVNHAHMIKALDHRLKTLHIHDNDSVTDLHNPPFMGNIDWQIIMDSLVDIGFDGSIMLESDIFLKNILPEQLLNALKGYYALTKRLQDMTVRSKKTDGNY